jgi:hypothetical protein
VSKEHIPDPLVSGGAPIEIHTPQQLAKRLQVKPSWVYGPLATQPDSLSPAVPVQRDRHFQIARRFEFPSIPSNNEDFGRNAAFDLILS